MIRTLREWCGKCGRVTERAVTPGGVALVGPCQGCRERLLAALSSAVRPKPPGSAG